MGDIVAIDKSKETRAVKGAEEKTVSGGGRDTEPPYARAVVPTIDIYAARVLYNLTQRMVEDVVDRRISLLEKQIEERDKEVMRTIRRIQAKMVMEQNKVQLPWWRRLFSRRQT
ncbi:MAG: hypothetical protein K6T29_05845 [Peptococcaceae bacterium]|nr:hypothetical protein [Peptococcaceae bacterium]